MKQTAVEWLFLMMNNPNKDQEFANRLLDKAKEIEKEQMIDFAEYVAGYPDKNRNYLGQILHSQSKYDEANSTLDLLEQYYNETYKG